MQCMKQRGGFVMVTGNHHSTSTLHSPNFHCAITCVIPKHSKCPSSSARSVLWSSSAACGSCRWLQFGVPPWRARPARYTLHRSARRAPRSSFSRSSTILRRAWSCCSRNFRGRDRPDRNASRSRWTSRFMASSYEKVKEIKKRTRRRPGWIRIQVGVVHQPYLGALHQLARTQLHAPHRRNLTAQPRQKSVVGLSPSRAPIGRGEARDTTPPTGPAHAPPTRGNLGADAGAARVARPAEHREVRVGAGPSGRGEIDAQENPSETRSGRPAATRFCGCLERLSPLFPLFVQRPPQGNPLQ